MSHKPAAAMNPCEVIAAAEKYLRGAQDAGLYCLPGDVPLVRDPAGGKNAGYFTRPAWTRYVLAAKLATCRQFFLGEPEIVEEWVPGETDAGGRFVPGHLRRESRDVGPGTRCHGYLWAKAAQDMDFLRRDYDEAYAAYQASKLPAPEIVEIEAETLPAPPPEHLTLDVEREMSLV